MISQYFVVPLWHTSSLHHGWHSRWRRFRGLMTSLIGFVGSNSVLSQYFVVPLWQTLSLNHGWHSRCWRFLSVMASLIGLVGSNSVLSQYFVVPLWHTLSLNHGWHSRCWRFRGVITSLIGFVVGINGVSPLFRFLYLNLCFNVVFFYPLVIFYITWTIDWYFTFMLQIHTM
jgi:hypothetical protein